MTDVLLVTCSGWPDGEPGAAALDEALVRRGIDAAWVCWDDRAVDWAAARLVAVRSTWDYVPRWQEFLAWSRRVEETTRLLNGADTFAWNIDKTYLSDLRGVPVVPIVPARSVPELAAAVARFGTAVVKPRVGAAGAGVYVADHADDPRLGQEVDDHPELHNGRGPWVVQPLVESVRTEGETSVFLLAGEAVTQVDKTPGGGEIRVHEHFGGRSRTVAVRDEAADVALAAFAAAQTRLGRRLEYGRADLMRLADGTLAVNELELIEPGLYLDIDPANGDRFADVVLNALSTAGDE